jgi:hypothetical protein
MAKNDFYKNFERFENAYRDFTSSTKRGAQDLAALAPISYLNATTSGDATITFYVELINTLFPLAGGAFVPAGELWKKLKDLAVVPNNAPDEKKKNAALAVANCMRVYYYNGNPDEKGDQLENQIQEFYKDVRPSAYLIPEYEDDVKTSGTRADKKTERKHKRGLLRDCVGTDPVPSPTSKLMMILIDTPVIDMKLRGAEKVDAFMNYSPSILMSQCVPYLSAQFILNRKNIPNEQKKQSISMGQLKFLMGAEEIKDKSITSLMYDSSILRQIASAPAQPTRDQEEKVAKDVEAKGQKAEDANDSVFKGAKLTQDQQRALAAIAAGGVKPTDPPVRRSTDAKNFVAGMELFTMPQTLINMDYDGSTTKKFQPTLNPTLPFGVITNLSVNVAGSVGVISFKSAKLTLRIFDRSRMVEIADFMNPKLYQSTTIWLTYGWRAPRQVPEEVENPYLKFINENMMTREAYGIKGTSMTIDDTGTVTIVLDLFTKGTSELINIKSSGKFEEEKEKIENSMSELRDILQRLGIKSYNIGGSDVRGSILINAANNGTFPDIDYNTFNKEFEALTKALANVNTVDATRAKELLAGLFNRPSKDNSQTKAQLNLQTAAKSVATTRFSSLTSSKGKDPFAFFEGKFANDNHPLYKEKQHPLSEIINGAKSKDNKPGSVDAADVTEFQEFGNISFGKLFVNYFLQAAANASSVIDEYQVIFYSLNSRAGRAASLNIAEFPIDMTLLKKAYAKRVEEQKGENMSILNFLEIVRASQFEDVRHRAFGFFDLFTYEKGALIANKQKADTFQQRMIENFGKGGSFTQPTLDFFVETGYMKKGENSLVQSKDLDLLRQFEKLSVETSSRVNDRSTTRIMRIHVYDRAATPHHTTSTIMSQGAGKFVSIDTTAFKSQVENAQRVTAEKLKTARGEVDEAKKKKNNEGNIEAAQDKVDKTQAESLSQQLTDANNPDDVRKSLEADGSGGSKTKFEVFDFGNPPSFAAVKKKISEFTPTILIGSNGTAVKNVSYNTGQDALLSTVMLLRNNTTATSVTNPDGSSGAGLPLRVIPGQLSLTTLGCPLVDYMQQYFVDLGTGTTVDNLYNVTGLTHNISPGSYQTEIKLTFYDAYGQYESPKNFVEQVKAMTEQVKNASVMKPTTAKPKK